MPPWLFSSYFHEFIIQPRGVQECVFPRQVQAREDYTQRLTATQPYCCVYFVYVKAMEPSQWLKRFLLPWQFRASGCLSTPIWSWTVNIRGQAGSTLLMLFSHRGCVTGVTQLPSSFGVDSHTVDKHLAENICARIRRLTVLRGHPCSHPTPHFKINKGSHDT